MPGGALGARPRRHNPPAGPEQLHVQTVQERPAPSAAAVVVAVAVQRPCLQYKCSLGGVQQQQQQPEAEVGERMIWPSRHVRQHP